MNFEFNTEFFIMIGMFLTIAFMITIIIVYFMTKLNTLNAFLDQAKEIDDAKIDKIAQLEIQLQEEKIFNINIMKEMDAFESSKKMLSEKERDIAGLRENISLQFQDHMESVHHQEMNFKELKAHHEILNENYDILVEKYRLLKKRNETLVQENTNFHTRLRDTQVQLNEQQKQNIEKLIKMKEQRGELKKEFEQLSINVFGGHPKGFSRLSQNNLSTMIKPLESQIDDFKGHIETLYKNNSKDEMILNQEILSLKELNRQISQDTINLINTLKGGENWHTLWSEMILQKVLEYSGLRKGIHYTMKVSLKNNNNMYRPDVLVHLPNKCDLIIDAKSSLNAYEKFISEDKDSNLKEAHLEEHIKSIRSHIKALSNKNYEQLLGINTLDFIFLFIPIEGALTIALERDKSLYDDAFKNHILLVSSTTLLIAMRAIENIWKDEKENQNAREIVNKAELLYGKFVKFSNDMIKISKQFDKLQTSFESSKKQLNSKKIDVVSRFEQKIT